MNGRSLKRGPSVRDSAGLSETKALGLIILFETGRYTKKFFEDARLTRRRSGQKIPQSNMTFSRSLRPSCLSISGRRLSAGQAVRNQTGARLLSHGSWPRLGLIRMAAAAIHVMPVVCRGVAWCATRNHRKGSPMLFRCCGQCGLSNDPIKNTPLLTSGGSV